MIFLNDPGQLWTLNYFPIQNTIGSLLHTSQAPNINHMHSAMMYCNVNLPISLSPPFPQNVLKGLVVSSVENSVKKAKCVTMRGQDTVLQVCAAMCNVYSALYMSAIYINPIIILCIHTV